MIWGCILFSFCYWLNRPFSCRRSQIYAKRIWSVLSKRLLKNINVNDIHENPLSKAQQSRNYIFSQFCSYQPQLFRKKYFTIGNHHKRGNNRRNLSKIKFFWENFKQSPNFFQKIHTFFRSRFVTPI